MNTIPLLHTDRLRLRPPVQDDFEAYAVFMASDRAVHMGGPLRIARSWGMFCHDVASWTLFGHGALMIEKLADGTCIGQVGINHGPLFPERELGWLLYEGYEGAGYAKEAALALRAWALAERGLSGLVSYIDTANRRSINLAISMGAVGDIFAPKQDPEDLVYRHP